MHDVFVVTSRGQGSGHIARIVYAASENDARQTHQANFREETIVDVLTRPTQMDVARHAEPPKEPAEWPGL